MYEQIKVYKLLKSTFYNEKPDVLNTMGIKIQDVWPWYQAIDCKILPSIEIKGVPFERVPQTVLAPEVDSRGSILCCRFLLQGVSFRLAKLLDLEKKHHTIDAMGEISSGFTCFTR